MQVDVDDHPIADQHCGIGLRFEFRAGEQCRTDEGESASLRRTCWIMRREIEDHTAGS
jgi:hypothetical protein